MKLVLLNFFLMSSVFAFHTEYMAEVINKSECVVVVQESIPLKGNQTYSWASEGLKLEPQTILGQDQVIPSGRVLKVKGTDGVNIFFNDLILKSMCSIGIRSSRFNSIPNGDLKCKNLPGVTVEGFDVVSNGKMKIYCVPKN